jgi:ribonuclease-3
VSVDRERGLRGLERRLGHRFGDAALLERALTHASFAHEAHGTSPADNEPLEFLGDAVLGLLVAELLHRRDPEGAEGEKSRRRARLVSAASLARRAAERGLPELLRLGRGEERSGGRAKAALWADAYEAVLAALYLDGGLEAARRFVAQDLAPELDRDEPLADGKSALQERLQAAGRPLPRYSVVAEEGPSHRRLFRVECRLDDGTVTQAADYSKKAAQLAAARIALARLDDAGEPVSPRSSPHPGKSRRRRRRRPGPA